MKVPATAVTVGLAMWLGLAAVAPGADVLMQAATAIEQKVIAARAQTQPAAPALAAFVVQAKAASAEQDAPVQMEADAQATSAAQVAKIQRTILVSLPDHKLALLVNGEVKVVYPVAVGKASTPSPVGDFAIVSRVANPTYSHKGKVVGPGPGNPVGTRWMGLSERGYGIHGTNAPSSIGKSASHGCIRMGRKDLEQLFTMVQTGDVVEIRGERDAQVAAVFGDKAPANVNGTAGVTVAVSTVSAPITRFIPPIARLTSRDEWGTRAVVAAAQSAPTAAAEIQTAAARLATRGGE